MAAPRPFRLLAGFAAGLLLVLGGASASVADQLYVDGDAALPLGGSTATVVACASQPVQFNVLIGPRRNGQENNNANNNVFKDGTAVTVGLGAATGGMTATLADTTILLPSNWQSAGNSAPDVETVTAVVTLPAKTAAGSGTIAFTYIGVNNAGSGVPGNTPGSASVNVSWTIGACDTTPPALQLPAPITAEATSAAGAVVTYAATATDAAPLNPAVTCSPASGATFPLGTTTVSCSATDTANNVANGSFTVSVDDTTAPAVGQMTNLQFEAVGELTSAVWINPAATDAVDGSLSSTCVPASGTGFAVGSTTVTCSATDAHGNTGSSAFTVKITDSTAPILVLPAEVTAEATGPGGAVVTFTATATDLVDGSVSVGCVPASGSTFVLGATVVECSATDLAGNTSNGSFAVVVEDTTAPTVTAPAPVTLEATGPGGATAEFSASASDLVDGSVATSCSPASGSLFEIGTTTVTCSATDAAANTGSATFDVTVVDTTPPVVTVPGPITAEATAATGAAVTFTATAADIVDGAVEAVCVPASGSVFALGTHQVDCTATDETGNGSAPESFSVTVVDTTAPAITVPGTTTVEATGPAGAAVSFSASATDLVDGSVTPACSPASGSTFPLGDSTVTCTASDSRDNSGSESFTVSVVDTTAPEITWVGGPANGGNYVFGSVPPAATCTATDIVDGTVACAVTGYSSAVGSHTLTASATDAAGNLAASSRTYSVAAWTLGGFFQPVDMGGVWNSVKGGSTVPLKFEVFAGATELTSTTAVSGFVVKSVSCASGGGTDEIELTTTGATTLRYDATGGQFIQNWQTPKKPGACYQVTMTTQDGSALTAQFKLK